MLSRLVIAFLPRSKSLFFFFNFTIFYWFCHISKWICHRYICVPHPEPSSPSLPIPSLWVVPVHQPQASSIVHWTWMGDSFHIWYYTYFNVILPNHPTCSFSHRVQKTVLYISVSFAVSYTGSFNFTAAVTIWVILEPKKLKSLTVSIVSPIYLPWSDGTGCHDLSFLNVEL